MNIFEQHEILEIGVLDKLKRAKILDDLVFGGGTMLRLCHEMKRYSVDLDFWRIKDKDEEINSKLMYLRDNSLDIELRKYLTEILE